MRRVSQHDALDSLHHAASGGGGARHPESEEFAERSGVVDMGGVDLIGHDEDKSPQFAREESFVENATQ